MAMKNSLVTFGFTDIEIQDLEMADLVSLAKEKGLTNMEIENLKSYRRLLKVRIYGKDSQDQSVLLLFIPWSYCTFFGSFQELTM